MKGINCKLSALPKFDTQGNRIIDETPVKHKTVADLRFPYHISCYVSSIQNTSYNLINCTYIIHTNAPYLCRRLIGKIQKGRTIQSYVVASVHDNTRQAVLPRDTVLQLARSGRIINAKSQMNGDTVVLRECTQLAIDTLHIYNVFIYLCRTIIYLFIQC